MNFNIIVLSLMLLISCGVKTKPKPPSSKIPSVIEEYTGTKKIKKSKDK